MPNKSGKRQITTWVSPDDHETLQQVAGELGISMAEMARRAIERYAAWQVQKEGERRFGEGVASV